MEADKQYHISSLINRIDKGSALDTAAMLQDYLEYVRIKLDASITSWVCAYRGKYVDEVWKAELFDGWKIMDNIVHTDCNQDLVKFQEEYFQKARTHGVDPLTMHALQQAGKTRTHRYVEVFSSYQEWQEHWVNRDFILDQNIGERMLGIFTLDEEAESYIVIERPPGDRPFSQADEDILMYCLIEFPRLHYWLFLERGLLKINKRPNSPRQRELIPLILSGMPEKQIADTLELSKTTIHGYIQDIYRNYDVRSRYELMSLWLADFS